jgi:transglycosylase-like protein with SLT domain
VTLFSGFDITPFLSRPSVPYQAPKAADISPVMSALDTFTQMMQLHQQQAAEQQRIGLQKSAQDETKRYHDIESARYQATDARLNKAETDKHIAEIQKALPDAQASGDQAKVQALLQELGRVTGWQMGEFQTNYQPPAAQPAPAQAAAPTGGPTDFDAAYQAMIQKESGGNPKAVNPQSGAMGTFQLMPDQLKAMGLTKDQFLAMTPEQQRQIYETKYLPAHGLSKDTLAPQDVGLSVGAPAAISMPDDAVVYPKGSKAVAQNPSWDRNKDGQITAAELRQNYGGAPAGPPASIAAPPADQPQTGPAPFLQDFMGQQPPAQDQAPSGAMPWEMLGLGSPPPPKPEEPVPGGGRYVFKDASGKVQYEYDRTKVQGEQRSAVTQGLQPLLDNATTPEEKKAAKDAIGFASAAVGNGLNPKEAFTQGMAFYRDRVNSADKTARANVAPQLGSIKLLHSDAEHIHTDTVKQYHLDALNDAEKDLDDGLAALRTPVDPKTGNALGQTAALAHFAQSMTHRLTDFEFKNFANSAGIMDQAMGFLNRLLTGERTPAVMAQLEQLLVQAKQANAAQRQKAADSAAQAILSAQYPGISPDLQVQYADRARNRLLGAGPSTPQANATPTAPSNYAGKSIEDLAAELGQ